MAVKIFKLYNKKIYIFRIIYSIVMNKDEKMKVTNTDLLKNRYTYSIDILEQNIVENHLDEKILLATQTLTPEFCVKYILDLDIEGGGEESYIFDVCYILSFQKHITEKELTDLINISDDFVV